MDIKTDYTGYKVIYEDDLDLPNLYSNKTHNWYSLFENQYLVIKNTEGVVVDKFKWQAGKYKSIYRKPVESLALGKIKPKNYEQELAIDALFDEQSTVKVLAGVFGSGKDLLMTSCAFQMIQEGRFDRIIWIRNNIEVKDSNPVGFLPGDKFEKLEAFAAPLADHCGSRDALSLFIQQGKIEVEHLGFIRGRDFKNAIIYCSEAEHLTRKHVQLILGRIGEGSILFLNGDWRQIDARVFENDNGLIASIERLKGNKLFSYVKLNETVRSETAKLADLLD